MTVAVVTTCNKAGWDVYGERMYTSFLRHWSQDIQLFLCAEDFTPHVTPHNVTLFDFPSWFLDWKASHSNNKDAHGVDKNFNRKNKQQYDYRRDCVRFSHKVAALTHIATTQRCDLLIWLDADIVSNGFIDTCWLHGLFPNTDDYMAWLWRIRPYPECGFMMFRPQHLAHVAFMTKLRHIYQSNDVFGLPETHDSFVIAHVVKSFGFRPFNLSGPTGERSHSPFDFSKMRAKLEHLKGERKHANFGSKTAIARRHSR